MRKHALFIFILLLAAAGGVVRAFEIFYVFDPVTGLAVPGHFLSVFTGAVTVFTAILIIFPASGGSLPLLAGYTAAFKSLSGKYSALNMAASLMLIISACINIFEFAKMSGYPSGNQTTSRLILAVLAILCAAAIFFLSRACVHGFEFNSLGIWALIPIAYGCFFLILTFSDRAADPVIVDYIYELLAAVSIVLAFYYNAGFAFRSSKVRRALIFSLFAFYFSMVSLIGPLIYTVMAHIPLDTHSAFRLFTFAFASVYFFPAARTLSLNAMPKAADKTQN